jgi:hypothetical protein
MTRLHAFGISPPAFRLTSARSDLEDSQFSLNGNTRRTMHTLPRELVEEGGMRLRSGFLCEQHPRARSTTTARHHRAMVTTAAFYLAAVQNMRETAMGLAAGACAGTGAGGCQKWRIVFSSGS